VKRIFRSWSELFREETDEWLLVDQRGEYQYRNPDSLYVHRWETFKTREAAEAYIANHIARADLNNFRLYQRVAPSATGGDDE